MGCWSWPVRSWLGHKVRKRLCPQAVSSASLPRRSVRSVLFLAGYGHVWPIKIGSANHNRQYRHGVGEDGLAYRNQQCFTGCVLVGPALGGKGREWAWHAVHFPPIADGNNSRIGVALSGFPTEKEAREQERAARTCGSRRVCAQQCRRPAGVRGHRHWFHTASRPTTTCMWPFLTG